MTTKPIIALDIPSKQEAISFLDSFEQESLFLKIGMELYYSEGPDLIRELKEKGHQIFLDLKLHDIPNTVYRAMKVLATLEVDMVNVHAAGGTEMMQAAVKGLEEGTKAGKKRPLLIAVTQLTSTTEKQMQSEQLIDSTLDNSVTHYAKLAYQAGLDGVVCSALEARMIHEATSQKFLCVTPGIRPSGSDEGDQKRVATPEFAAKEGATHIVVGRPITQVEYPIIAYKNIDHQWKGDK
ncbi:orotidine-5'-phosphate decarboxylase [Desemzia sp. RIT804]|uniref:orotidine-5'-phosphate decarboxylase n=1 Tax=Desemzia sp. RIT 804 TaxID=2810209 RepID=UPI0019511069|nr:orotidine-5'-phosphate decarboxylase [Desemzia sp. RIT 804]